MVTGEIPVVPLGHGLCHAWSWHWRQELHATIMVKATFALQPGTVMAPVETLSIAPDHRQPYLPCAEMLFFGAAHMPRPLTAVTVRMALLREQPLIDKAVVLRSAEPFVHYPVPELGPGASPSVQEPWPDDVDWQQLLLAPADQRCSYLRGDEWVLLEGLSQRAVLMRSRLPNVGAEAWVRFSDGTLRAVQMMADRLLVDGDQSTCTVFWRGSFVETQELPLSGATLWAGASYTGRPLVHPERERVATPFEKPSAPTPPSGVSAPATVQLSDAFESQDPVLPFQSAPGSQAVSPQRHPAPSVSDGALPFVSAPATPVAPSPWAQEAAVQEAALGQPLGDAQVAHHLAPWASSEPLPHEEPRASAVFDPDAWHERSSVVPDVMPGAQSASGARAVEEPTHPVAADTRGWSNREITDQILETLGPRTLPQCPVWSTSRMTVGILRSALRPPHLSLTVVAKATCDLDPQEGLCFRDKSELLQGDDPATPTLEEPASIRYPSDVVPFKPNADVVLAGHAHPPASANTACQVRLAFGHAGNRFDRRLAVFGERFWQRGAMTAPAPFERIELSWDNAYGGAGDPLNPVGMGRTKDDGANDVRALPFIEDPSALLHSSSNHPHPVCFAPIPTTWPCRWSMLGTFDAHWKEERWPHPPADFDWHFYQAAPEQQQLEHLRGDEPFTIEGVVAEGGRIDGALPGIRPRVFALATQEAGAKLSELNLHLDTVTFDTDEMKVNLVWRGVIEVSAWESPEMAAFFVLDEALAERPKTEREILGAFYAAVTPLEPVEDEPEQPTEPANDVAAEPSAGPPAPDFPDEAELQAAFEAQTGPHLDALQAQIDAAAPQSGIDVRRLPPPEGADHASILASARRSGVSNAQLLTFFGPIAGGQGGDAAATSPSVAQLVDGLKHEMSKAGVPQADIDESMSVIPDLDEPPPLPDVEPPDVPALSEQVDDVPEAERARVVAALERGDELDGLRCLGADLSDLDFSGRSMKGALLEGCDLGRAVFDGCDLSDAHLSRAEIREASFAGATLDGADFTEAGIEACRFDGASVEGTCFDEVKGAGVSFVGSKGVKVSMVGADLSQGCFDGAELDKLDVTNAELSGARFIKARLTDVRLYGAKGKDVHFSEADLSGARADGVELPDLVADKAVAEGSVWEAARLDGACFTDGRMNGASFVRATMIGAVFNAVRLRDGRFDSATLSSASFIKADLMGASFEGAELSNSDMRGANLYGVASWRATTTGARFEQAYREGTQIGEGS